jgi:hypothetical protein
MAGAEGILAIVAVFGTGAYAIRAGTQIYMKHLELKRVGGSPMIDAAIEERLERIEQAVDSIALEVERVSEGQRFTTRLLSERTGLPPAPGAR